MPNWLAASIAFISRFIFSTTPAPDTPASRSRSSLCSGTLTNANSNAT
jgi:hypothetical protein